MRKLASAAVASGLLIALAGCAGGPLDPNACIPDYATGGSAELVGVEGAFGQQSRLDFPTPLVSKEPRVQLVSAGEGERVRPGDYLEFEVTIADGRTGEVLTGSGFAEGSGIGRIAGTDLLSTVALCATEGSRLVATAPISEVFTPQIVASAGYKPTDSVVLAYDLERRMPGRATGADQLLLPSGLPAIVLAPNGEPGLTLPKGEAPSELRIGALKVGSGPVVESGDTIIAHYTGVLWGSGRVFDSSWDAGLPRDLPAVSMEDSAEGGVIPGFAQAIIGQTVGSQVVAVIPPGFGYPEGQSPSTIPEGSTLIFVIDILGIR